MIPRPLAKVFEKKWTKLKNLKGISFYSSEKEEIDYSEMVNNGKMWKNLIYFT